MSKPKSRRLTGHAARRLAVKRANRRAYGRKRLAVDARANRMGPTIAEGLEEHAGGCLGACAFCLGISDANTVTSP